MNETNTPAIDGELIKNGLSHIPEAHCYLKIGEQRFDFTGSGSNFSRIQADVINEQEIFPEQVSNYKVEYHKAYLKDWLSKSGLSLSFEELWAIRENCIRNMAQ